MNIKLEQFEGPLALLVKLIDKAELDITQLSLAQVADQYIAHLKSMTDLNPDEMADFLVVASRLLLIKAKALLPYLLPEEEQAIEDLEHQLRMYKEFMEASKKIEKMVAGKHFMFQRVFNRKSLVANLGIFAPPKNLNGAMMAAIFQEVIMNIKPVITEKLEEGMIMMTINIEEKIKLIQQSVVSKIRSRFSELISQATSKVEVIVSFLAMLELMKQRTINADQDGLFSEIEIFKLELENQNQL
jgi:segregation and condensation protein A